MGKTIRGTERNDTLQQDGRVEVRIFGLGGNDRIGLDRDDDNGGGNFVDAGKGNDTVVNVFEGGNRIILGAGNDTYFGTGFSLLNGLDVVDGGAGNDRFFVETLLSTYKGGAGKDIFFSNGHKNDFIGGNGKDTISYQFRHEGSVVGDEGVTISLGENGALTGSNSSESLVSIENAIGSLNSDIVAGSSVANTLMGLGGDDDLHGLGGNDILIGGLGSDFLFGGTGADRFVFENTIDSPQGAADQIKDFSRAAGDVIDLSAIDADVNTTGNQQFNFIGSAAFSGNAGEVRFAGGILFGQTNGDAGFDMVIGVDNTGSMQASDFIL